jgi:PAS domain S-box-containing protein
MANVVLLIVEIWLLSALVLFTHHLSPRLGFAPLIFLLGGLTALLQVDFGVYIEPVPQFLFFVHSNLLVPVLLMGILVLYVANGAVPARLTMLCLLGLMALMLVLISLYRVHLSLPGGGSVWGLSINDTVRPLETRTVLASMLAFAADMFIIVVSYQGIRNAVPKLPEWVVVGLSLLFCLWMDALVFNFGSYLGTPQLFAYLPGQIVGKTLAALFIWPLAAFYLTRIAPTQAGYVGPGNRRTFDLLFGSLESVKMQLVRAEASLEQSEIARREQAAYFQEVFDHVSEGLWLAAPGQVQLYVSPAYARIYGTTAAGLYVNPQSFRDAIHPDDKVRVLAAMDRQGEGGYDEIYRILRPDGTTRWVRDRAFPVFNEHGTVYRIAGIVEDITERKEGEQQRVELETVNARMALLRDFIDEASHDLKSPLTAINLKIYLLDKTDDPQKRREHLSEMQQASTRMNKMIDDLLTLARVENVHDYACIDLDVPAFLDQICRDIRPRSEQKGQTLTLDVPEALTVRIVANADDLARAFANLVENAVLYTPDGGSISVSAQADAQQLVVIVRDSGIGIAPDDLPRIFDRFFRADNSRRSVANGTGLGLPIVKRVVEQHGGRIEVQSVLNSGTTFTVTLPLAE